MCIHKSFEMSILWDNRDTLDKRDDIADVAHALMEIF